MDSELKLNIKLNRARFNLMLMILLSAINFYFLLSSENFYLPFSSSISSYSIVLGVRASSDLGIETFKVIGIILACLTLLIYIFCYLKSKSNGFYLFMSFTLFVADTLALIVITIAFKTFGALSIIDIIVHIMTLFFLWSGVQAQGKLTRLKKANGNEEEATEDFAEADDGNVETLLSGNFNNNRVLVFKKGEVVELSVNDNVCGSLEAANSNDYELKATVDEVEFTFQYKGDNDVVTMLLYADDVLLDSKAIE